MRADPDCEEVAGREAGRAGDDRRVHAHTQGVRTRSCRTALRSRRETPDRCLLIGRHHHSLLAIPRDGGGEPVLERHLGPPAEPAQLRRVERVAAIVPGPIRDRLDERRRAARASVEDPMREIDVRALRSRRRRCRPLRRRPCSISRSMRPAVVVHVQPVAHVQTVAVERQRQVVDRVGDEERNHLLGELVRPVVVRRARDDHRHAVGGQVAVGQAIGAGLARRVRIARAAARRSRGCGRSGRCRTPRRSRSGRSGAAAAPRARPRAARTCRRRRCG